MYDIIIVGAGPAGISASLYAKRAGASVLVLYYGESNLEKATKIDNYYGFQDGISGKDLYESGIKQAINLGVDVKKEEVLDIKKSTESTFFVETENEKYESKVVVLATGNKKLKPNIEGIEEFDGKGISYCAICDGFFYRGKNVCVIGDGKYAISEANDLANVASNIKILTNGKELKDVENNNYEVIDKKILKITGDTKVRKIIFEDNSEIDIDGIFIAEGTAGSSDFAKKLGILTDKDNIVVNEKMETNVERIYSCGNSNGGLLQISKSIYEGAVAGLEAIKKIKE